ncbi:MAG TPA: glycosyltransferase family 9 protein [Fimbriimonadaceae bacterium]|jgi:ADP-heptose:LPS heptosyltransferase
MERIILLRSGALGDCIVSIPTLRLLRAARPDAHISLIGSPYSGQVFQAAPYFNDIHLLTYKPNLPRYVARLLAIRRNRYQISIDFQATGRTRGQTALIGAKKRIAFDVKGIPDRYLYTDVIDLDRRKHVADRLADLLAPLGIKHSTEDLYPTLDLTEEHRRQASYLLRQKEVLKPFIVLQCSCGKRAPERHWSPERFAEVSDWFFESGIQVVVCSATQDPEVARVIAAAKHPITNLCGRVDALVFAAILEQAALYVGYNTGPMHLAAAVGSPIVALYDLPGDLVEWAPLSKAPLQLVCSKPDSQISSINAAQVINAAEMILESSRDYDAQASLR